MLDELDPRDGPTKEFLNHHEVMSRAKSPGKIKKDRLLIMVRGGDITPSQCRAGERFAEAYHVVQAGLGSSTMYRVSGGTGGGGHDLRVDMATLLRKANDALNAEHGFVGGTMINGSLIGALSPGMFMVKICAEDKSFKELGSTTGLHEERVRTRAALMLQTLGRFFDELDRKAGVSRTPGTIEQIMAARDPEEAA